MAKQFTLGKKERLKSRKQTERLFSGGKKFTLPPFRVHYLEDPAQDSPLKFGTGVSLKLFARAVDRNRIKRLTREAYRLQKNRLQEKMAERPGGLTVFFIYTGKELPAYETVYAAIGQALKKLVNQFAAGK